MMKRLFLLGILVSFFASASFAQNFIPLKNLPDSLEIEVLNVSVSIEGTDETFASYSFVSDTGKKLSCVENRGTFRIRTVYESDGIIRIKIPKTHLIERMRITSALASITVKNISVVHTHILLTRGDIDISGCQFKTSVLTQNTGSLLFSAGVKSSALCLTNVEARVQYLGEKDGYHIDYSCAGSYLNVNGQVLTNLQGVYGENNAQKRSIISLSHSNASVSFP